MTLLKNRQYLGSMTYEVFASDARTFDAVLRNLEIMGEAANLLPRELRERNSEIEWNRIVGLRNRLIHGYFGVDAAIVWHITRYELPSLVTAIHNILHHLNKNDT